MASSTSSKPPSKRQKVNCKTKDKGTGIIDKFEKERNMVGECITDFKFNKNRVQMISKEIEVPEKSNGILYWMSRDQRVQDNWAFLFAQRLAMKQEMPLHVAFCLVPKFLDATYRHYNFILGGLKEVSAECHKLGISFHLLLGYAKEVLPPFVKENNIGGVVTDFAPLKVPQQWVIDIKVALPSEIPFCQVDAHNIIPCWVTSDKQEYSARTIRKKIHDKLPDYLTKFPPVVKHPFPFKLACKEIDWKAAENMLEVDQSVGVVDWAKPGTGAGLKMLEEFCNKRLNLFNDKRNNPTVDALSNLSPWIHFGQISAQRCILEVKQYKKQYSASVDAYIEEAVVRRELSENYCFYQKNYDNINGAYDWAKTTLELHKKDKRPYIYTRQVLDEAKTHDDLWNSAQIQLLKEGKMHGFLRMYWAKKILEWTSSPEEALATALYLNDRYSLDGRDPSGYVGCMWSICGIHDQGWAERDVFGKIRYMNYAGCKRMFDIKAFIARYGGKEHKYVAKK